MRKIFGLSGLVAAMALSAALPMRDAAAADNNLGISIGGLAGVAFPSATGASSRFGWGFEGNYKLLPELTAGVFYLSSSQSITVPTGGGSSVNTDQAIHLYGAQAGYQVYTPGLSVGARIGAGNTSSTAGSISNSSTDFALGPYLSYDYHFAPMWSVGGDASIIFVTGSGSFNEVNLLATVKIWL